MLNRRLVTLVLGSPISAAAWWLGEPVKRGREGRIHFAGEHLSPWFSWMQGALSSGLMAVKEIDEAARV